MEVRQGRWSAEVDGEVVVFLLGMHVNRRRDVRGWMPVFAAMPRMLRELADRPELGLLHASIGWIHGGPAVTQYWRSHEHLEAYARDPGRSHLPAWRAFNRAARESAAVGVWHETYRVTEGSWETIYAQMPPVGLALATDARPLGSTSTSATRLGARTEDADAAPVAP